MKRAWKAFRAVISVLMLLAVLLPTAIYVLLSLDPVQAVLRQTAEKELSNLLGAELSIGRVNIHPFTRLSVRDIDLTLEGDSVASISTVSAGLKPWPLITRGEFVIDYALIDGLKLNVWRDSINSPLNVQPILDKLKGNGNNEQKRFSLAISSLIVRRASASYNIRSAAEPDSAVFDPQHIAVTDLAINAFIPQLSTDHYRVHLDHLSFAERSGFVLDKLSANVDFGPEALVVENLLLALPSSRLAFKPLTVTYSEPKAILNGLTDNVATVSTDGACSVYLPDVQAFAPILGEINAKIALELDADFSLSHTNLRRLRLSDEAERAFTADIHATATDLQTPSDMAFELYNSNLTLYGAEISRILGSVIPAKVGGKLRGIANLEMSLTGKGTLSDGSATLLSQGTPGKIAVDASYSHTSATTRLSAKAFFDNIDLTLLAGDARLGTLSASVDAHATFAPQLHSADALVAVDAFEFNGYTYSDAKASFTFKKGHSSELDFAIDDPSVGLLLYALYDESTSIPSLKATASLTGLDLSALGFDRRRPGYKMGAKLNVDLPHFAKKDLVGSVELSDFYWLSPEGKGLEYNRLLFSASPDGEGLSVYSPIVEGSMRGKYDFGTLIPELKALAFHFMPALEAYSSPEKLLPGNDFSIDFTVKPCPEISEFFGINYSAIYNIDITGRVATAEGKAFIDVDAPYIGNGDKLIEHTHAFVQLDIPAEQSNIFATTQFPTKKGDFSVAASVVAADNRIDTKIDWGIARTIPLNGSMAFSAELLEARTPVGSLFPVEARVDFMPGTINFGDETWSIQQSSIVMSPEKITVDNFALDTGSQRIAIAGNVGNEPDDKLLLNLKDIKILPIFETLEIENVYIGGRATGEFTATDLLGDTPDIVCPDLHVDSIGFNRCAFGDAEIFAQWQHDRKAVHLDADLTGFEKRKSHIWGDIFPMGEALDLNFQADSIQTAFLQPFMAAFASSVSGRATGWAHLFGTFKEIDLEGDVYAHDIKLKVDFTNVEYAASDTVHIRPGSIDLRDITVRDPEGHTAKLNGYLKHKFFKEPVFNFDITNARDFLCLNLSSRQNPDWYGTIYGNGKASISGEPGVVNIGANMDTAPRSTFTFVMSDRLDAEDYSFLTFRDITPDSLRVNVIEFDDTPILVKNLKKKNDSNANTGSSEYNMDIKVNATPDAAVTLVMDPVAGDEIKAVGSGSLHIAYYSANSDFNIWGKYNVLSGKYRFTLQDIIIKDFTIKEGSEIRFDGDPEAIKANISAYYATNANLSDLDESFLSDKDVARTNVPVHAILNVSGDIRQPIIDFDLEFPTLTSDTYRKVRSIVSTSDMMNRQIIYLLALNRFYTPDYMASTTKGNELFSVASSTISSQLGNMLGKLNDNWSIAPNLRSDRGDFSDLEVDVALSSRLLNNRLLFNGNLGYRDKSLNRNQFIGDFDIEYLLDKRGIWRLKAYNRYNDRNYYLRSALTTQGVGIIFRRDFDDLFKFMKKKQAPTDSIQ